MRVRTYRQELSNFDDLELEVQVEGSTGALGSRFHATDPLVIF
jgi:hypothetical protein